MKFFIFFTGLILVAYVGCSNHPLNGTWIGTLQMQGRGGQQMPPIEVVYELKISGAKLSGAQIMNVSDRERKTKLQEGKFENYNLSFTLEPEFNGMKMMKIKYKGVLINETQIKLTWERDFSSMNQMGGFAGMNRDLNNNPRASRRGRMSPPPNEMILTHQ